MNLLSLPTLPMASGAALPARPPALRLRRFEK